MGSRAKGEWGFKKRATRSAFTSAALMAMEISLDMDAETLGIKPHGTPVTEPEGDSFQGTEVIGKFDIFQGFIHVSLIAAGKVKDQIAGQGREPGGLTIFHDLQIRHGCQCRPGRGGPNFSEETQVPGEVGDFFEEPLQIPGRESVVHKRDGKGLVPFRQGLEFPDDPFPGFGPVSLPLDVEVAEGASPMPPLNRIL